MAGLSSTQLELGAVAAAVALALAAPGLVKRVARPLLRGLDSLARRPLVAAASVGALSFVGALVCALLVQWPTARVHDELSYLLAADTFAAGRLSNPQPPCAEQLEAFHVVTQPVYAAKYPSGQGLALALGQVVCGDPAWGVWFTAALFSASFAWMLLGFLPGRWALLGALVVVLRITTTSYWAQSYWGGALTAAGSALAFGALVRIFARGSLALGLVLGLGLSFMALTRPFEGAVACLPILVALAWWSMRRARTRELAQLAAVAGGAALPLAACLAWMVALNLAITGDALRMPYFLHDAQYVVAPPFVWQGAAPKPVYLSREIEEFWTGFAYDLWAEQQSLEGFLRRAWIKLGTWWSFFVGIPLSVALLGVPFALRRRWLQFGALVFACVGAGVLAVAYDLAHYMSPAAPWIVALCIGGLRALAAWRPLRAKRRGLAVVLAMLALIGVECVARGHKRARPDYAFEFERARIERALAEREGKALVVVRYLEGHSVHDDWVFNRAEIEAAPVVWARDHGEAAHERLRACFPARAGYLLTVGPQGPPILSALWP